MADLLIRDMNALARNECNEVNDEGRRQSRLSGDWDNRTWLHPQEWVRIRPPLVILAHIAKVDGRITDAENGVVSRWINEWIVRSYWGEVYSGSKKRALEALILQLQTDSFYFEVACEMCARKLSKAQKASVLKAIDEMAATLDTVTLAAADHARSALSASSSFQYRFLETA